MKIKVNNTELFELTETQKKVIQNEIPSDIFEEDMKRRLKYILMHKYEQCFKKLKSEWEPKLIAQGAKSIPAQPDDFAKLIFGRSDYKDRSARDLEAEKV